MRHRLLRAAVGAAGAIVVGGTLVAIPVSAATIKPVTACGTQITSKGHWVLQNDIGPCKGIGVLITSSAVTLDLNGHTITGNDTNNTSNAGGADFSTNPPTPIPGNSEQVGVGIFGAHGVKVMNGNVTAFDAGILVGGGGGNTVTGINAHDNIAHVLLIKGLDSSSNPCTVSTPGCMWNTANPPPLTYPCNDGDGIFTDNSNSNSITGNTSYHNGPFDGIALVDSSNNNEVSGNTSSNQTVSNIVPAYSTSSGPSTNGPCGPFSANVAGPGRPHQDIGIRIEGPGADNNVVSSNTVRDNQLDGITVHAHVCASSPSFGGPASTLPNDFNTIQNNVVSGSGVGLSLPGESPNGTGIAVLSEGPAGIVCPSENETITGNTSTMNGWNGLYLASRGTNNDTVTGNSFTNNGNDGVELGGGSSRGTTVFPGANTNTLSGNTITGNHHDGVELDRGSRAAGPPVVVAPGASSNTVTGNTITGNGSDGVELDMLTAVIAPSTTPVVVAGGSAVSNTVSSNTVSSNGKDGIQADGPLSLGQSSPAGASGNSMSGNTGSGNTTYDGDDDNTGCDSNSWSGDIFGTASQPCVM